MKASCRTLASINWKNIRGLGTQYWQKIPPSHYAVVTMDTTSASISISLHMAMCEGHTTSEIQIKVPEMKAAWQTISGWRSGFKWMFLTSSCYLWATSVENWGVYLDYEVLEYDFSLWVLLQYCLYTSIDELTHMKHNPVHTPPPNASIIQSPKFLGLFLSDIPFAWMLSGEQHCKAGEF